jgi:hypothetical protein
MFVELDSFSSVSCGGGEREYEVGDGSIVVVVLILLLSLLPVSYYHPHVVHNIMKDTLIVS